MVADYSQILSNKTISQTSVKEAYVAHIHEEYVQFVCLQL
nr:MAG TPA: hypothetical protein [Caudoviricetes sp.]DAM09503.1 MAG TPA: hypothetical protein [Bacteriophage sp.]